MKMLGPNYRMPNSSNKSFGVCAMIDILMLCEDKRESMRKLSRVVYNTVAATALQRKSL